MKDYSEQINQDLVKLDTSNEMAISRRQLISKCYAMSDIYAEHVQKILYWGDISASWRQFIWNSICFIPARTLIDTGKYPDTKFIHKYFIIGAFGIDYDTDPLKAIQRRLSYTIQNIKDTAKHGLPDLREVIYPHAAENVKAFNDELLIWLTRSDMTKHDIDTCITQYLAVEQVPWA